jgi:uncharacterized repeat protein (TIGR01451 family)
VWAWGNNGFGQLGDTTTTQHLTPVQSVGVTGAIEIAAGGGFSVARLSSPVDSLLTWGAEGQGQLGNGVSDLRPVPIQISGFPASVTQGSAGNGHTLALLNTGAVWGLGNNGNGQLGDNSTTRRLAPVASGLTANVTAISAGNAHSLARKNDGSVWAWGLNNSGQLGNNDITGTQQMVPVQVVGVGGTGLLANISGISASATNNYSLAVDNTGVVYAWGLNGFGQLGDGTMTNRLAPVLVSGLSGIFTAVSAGNNHSLALRNDGTVWAWGNNGNGQLGDGTFNNHLSPVQVPGLTGVTAISAGSQLSLALKSDGSIWTWGNVPGTFVQLSPVENMNFPSALSVVAGSGYALVTIQIGSIKWVGGWGANNNGQLGTGTFDYSVSGVPSLGFAGKIPSSVSANNHSLAVMTDGTLWGWGFDNNGQLGDSPVIFNATPTAPVARGVADLTITKTHVGNFSAGSPGSYTITVKNVGQATMSGTITVTDTLPAGMSFVSGVGTGWVCGAITGGASCTNPGPLAAGASSVITLNVNTTALMFPDQFNLATVSNASDVHALNNTTGDETSANTPTTVSLTPAPSPNPSTFGQSVSLTATVTPSAASGYVVFADAKDSGTFLGEAPVSSGTAHINTIMLSSGSRQLAAIFVPDPLTPYSVGFAPIVMQTVNPVASGSLAPFAASPLVLGGSKVGYLVANGDFNGDGKMDIAAMDSGSHSVTIYLGNGSGGFTPSIGSPFQTGSSPVAIVAVDLNRDGKVDLAIANQGVNTLTVLLGNGTGGFAAAPGSPFALGFNPTSIAVSDFNPDGTPRLGVAGLATTAFAKFKRDEFGNFFINTFPMPSGSYSGIASGDFNSDGTFDLAVSDTAGTVGINLKNPNGGYFPLVSIPSTIHPQGIVTADLNGDGKTDIVTYDATGIEVLLGNGSGGFAEAAGSPFVPGTGAITGISSVQVGDFNGDGKRDLFVVRTPSSTSKGEVVIMLGNGSGGFTQAVGGGTYAFLSSNLQNAVVADFNGDGRTDIAVTDPGNDAVVVLRGVPAAAQPISVTPNTGSSLTQTFTFTFNAPGGWQSLSVVDVLINNFLDGRNACYIAFQSSGASSGTVLLVDDAGDAGGPYSILTLPGTGTAQNSQCSIAGTGSSVNGSGGTLTLTLNITFKAGFAGAKTSNKVFYMAAQDTVSSGWFALGTWHVPGVIPVGPAVTGVTPPRSTTAEQIFTFAFTDTSGVADITVADVLINDFINGIGACYIAYIPSLNAVVLVDDAGDAGGPYAGSFVLGSGSASNTQCSINGATSSANGSGNTLTLTLDITFNHSFATGNVPFNANRVIYGAAIGGSGNSDWQAVAIENVP